MSEMPDPIDKKISSWEEYIDNASKEEYFKKLQSFIKKEGESNRIFPPYKDLYNAFYFSPLESTRVIILGQDPYIHKGEAHGLAFSVPKNVEPPPSLNNIFKEIRLDLDLNKNDFKHGCLIGWAKQGVLLLNTVLTVQENKPASHRNHGWETFTDGAISLLNSLDKPLVFLLWGKAAQAKKPLLNNKKHLVLEAAHPSPLAAHSGFFGCKHFSKTNKYLSEHKLNVIDWSVK